MSSPFTENIFRKVFHGMREEINGVHEVITKWISMSKRVIYKASYMLIYLKQSGYHFVGYMLIYLKCGFNKNIIYR